MEYTFPLPLCKIPNDLDDSKVKTTIDIGPNPWKTVINWDGGEGAAAVGEMFGNTGWWPGGDVWEQRDVWWRCLGTPPTVFSSHSFLTPTTSPVSLAAKTLICNLYQSLKAPFVNSKVFVIMTGNLVIFLLDFEVCSKFIAQI